MEATTAPSAHTAGPSYESQNDPMILRMIDWRGCSAIEYVPGRNAGYPTFVGRRIPVRFLVERLENGGSPEEYAADLHIAVDAVMAAVRYLRDDPPVEVVDLNGCPGVWLKRASTRGFDDFPVFEGTGISVESLFHRLKGGRTVEEFIGHFDGVFGPGHLNPEHVYTVLRHAAAQGHLP